LIEIEKELLGGDDDEDFGEESVEIGEPAKGIRTNVDHSTSTDSGGGCNSKVKNFEEHTKFLSEFDSL
jgi:hypothetical protein